jgi:hypothetical protein
MAATSVSHVSGLNSEPGRDEKANHFQVVRKSPKMLDAFWVILCGGAKRRLEGCSH